MNKFESIFFKKYVPEWQEILHILHIHPIVIFTNLVVKIILLILIPLSFYLTAETIHQKIPFLYVEIYLLIIFFILIYEIFDRYNDTWIITNSSIIWLDWKLFKTKTESINFSSIEWLWVDENWIIDKIFKKWDLIVHKTWEEEFILEEAINPYKAIDIIESAGTDEDEGKDEWNITEERFNMLLEAISWTVWEHIYNKELRNDSLSYKEKKDLIKKETIKKAEESDWTIDLR